MQIFVVLPIAGPVALEVEPSDSIDLVKQKLADATGIPVALQNLAYTGTALEDGLTLSDYLIGEGSTLELLLEDMTDRLDLTDLEALLLLNAKASNFYQEIQRTFRALERAKTRASFLHTRARLNVLIRQFTGFAAGLGVPPAAINELRRSFNSSLRTLKPPTGKPRKPAKRFTPRPPRHSGL